MRRGARSIRGALGAYLGASVVALVLLALVLWLGWPHDAPGGDAAGRDAGSTSGPGFVELPADAAWTEAALDDGQRQFSVSRGQRVGVPPGHYRLTLLSPDGQTESRELQVEAGTTLVR